MHLRLSLWAVLFVFSLGCVQAQPTPPAGSAPATAPGMANGQIVAKMVTGKVTMELNGTVTELANDAPVSPASTVTTAPDASVVLVFSNGATTQLGPDSSLTIEQFLQSPFKQVLALAAATQEPSTSRTKLKLNKGELLGKVAKLKHDQGSTFDVQTPVGAAGIRGTTFRLVFRPTGTGQAFAVFSLSTLEGNVNFQQGDGSGTPGPTPQTPAPEGGVPVVTGQEVVVTIAVEVSSSGQVTVTSPPVITSSQPMSLETQAAIARQAEVVATAAATTTFTPPPATEGNQGNQDGGQGEGDDNAEGQDNANNGNAGGDNNSDGNANNDNNGNNGNNNTPSPSPLPTPKQDRTTPTTGLPGS